jgi:hypothetical protein
MTGRVEYQKHWALSELLRRHQGGDDYCFVFEYHDDVVVLDREREPSEAAFYQIKTKNHGQWQLRELLRRDRPDDAEGLSILGKMYVNKKQFPDHTASLTFVSNVPCMARLSDGSGTAGDRDNVCVAELSEEERETILSQLREEHGAAVADGDAELIFLAHCDLALRNTEDHGVGKLDAFLRMLFPFRKLPVRAIYHALLSEISRRSGHDDIPSSFEQLVNQRGFSRAAVDRCLREAGVHHDPDESWEIVKGYLQLEPGWGPGMIRRIGEHWRRYEVERMNPEALLLQRFAERIRTGVRPFVDREQEPSLTQMLTTVVSTLQPEYATDLAILGSDYVRAMILFEYMETYANPFPPSGASASEEAP